ncbi:transcription factor MYB23, putative [Entamoeba invadens IP1]|uniref:transcription factor MYB23, putative n=1 Tax=Entamoeba invadens IP1 TaxID=370355 RepID=UPI0002C3D3D5|nr:transcription factor MYB23, putative [Entamoeba invadens IP1]ELP94054.1 transcription factor MYB23, putative [Entamoeba invadens IP1]|eukprot:XP_004260825.1 transcription factor MYB23, putative [Entamoeba invadens IP1]
MSASSTTHVTSSDSFDTRVSREKRIRKQGKMWDIKEDAKLLEAVRKYGESKWVEIAEMVGTRSRKQCRERYINHLNPTIDNSKWSTEEDMTILRQYALIGSKWCSIASCLNNRTARATRNRYYSLVHKKKVVSCFTPVVDGFSISIGGNPW